MTIVEALPIACTLAPREFNDRLASIAALNRDALRNYERRDLVLELRYALEARERVHEMVRNEQKCCAFLAFELHEVGSVIRLTVTAPERAREAADALFEQFVADAPAPSSCACASSASIVKIPAKEPPGSKAAGAAAMTLSTGAVACGACCVLPFTLPATVLASTGSLLSSFVHMHWWFTVLSVLAVMGAWGWIAWQMRRTGRKPATATLVMMTASTVFMMVSLMWPLIEKPLIRVLRA
jgi:hypothetical protein